MWIEKATVSRVATTRYGVTSNYVVGFRCQASSACARSSVSVLACRALRVQFLRVWAELDWRTALTSLFLMLVGVLGLQGLRTLRFGYNWVWIPRKLWMVPGSYRNYWYYYRTA